MVSNPLADDVSPWNLVGSQLQLNPPLRPNCRAEDHIFMWKGINSSPATTIDHPAICLLANLALQASLQDTLSYGSGLQKFHLFCDVFSVPEADQLPASFPLLHSFVLWASTDPGALGHTVLPDVPFEPVMVSVAKKYLSAVRA
jgi:hypothetical protein